MRYDFSVNYRSEVLVCASYGPLFVNAWSGTGNVADLDQMAISEQRVIDRYPEGIRVLAMVDEYSLASSPSPEFRRRVSEVLQEFKPHVHAIANLINAHGIRATIARTFITGVFLVSEESAPRKTFQRLEPALQWLARSHGPSNFDDHDVAALAHVFWRTLGMQPAGQSGEHVVE